MMSRIFCAIKNIEKDNTLESVQDRVMRNKSDFTFYIVGSAFYYF